MASRFGMDRKSITRLLASSHRRLIWRGIILTIAAWVIVSTLGTRVVLWQLEHRLNVKIHRKPFVVLVPGTVRLRNTLVDWNKRLQVRSGFLELRYPIYAFFWPWFSFSLRGENLAVNFTGNLRKTVGRDQVVFRRVSTTISVAAGRSMDVLYLDAESKEVEFHLKQQSSGKVV